MTELFVEENIKIFHWKEDITVKNIEIFRKALADFLEEESTCLILHLAGVLYVNSAALGAIAESVIQARSKKKEMIITGIEDTVEEIFTIVKFSSFITLSKTKEEGLLYFKGLRENESPGKENE